MIIFNKIDAYTWEEKDADDLTHATARNVSLQELIHTWMARLDGQCLFISAQERTNLDTLKQVLYNKVREMHVQKYPYNDFLFQHYEEEETQ
jgi:GTP-binding protein HflX